jgi:hypothetical protein
MDTRRGFFRKLKSAVVGGAAVAVGIAALPAKPVTTIMESTAKGVGETMWWLTGKHAVCKPLTYGDLERAYNDCMKGGEPQPYRIYMNMDDYRRGLGHEVG